MRTHHRRRLGIERLESRVLLTAVPGDANFDGAFDEADLVQVAQAGKYLTGQPADFSQGDWNGDHVFDPADLVAAMQLGHYRDVGVTISRTEVFPFLPAGDVGGGVLEAGMMFPPTEGSHSTLRRGSDWISYSLHTTGLPPGAYTTWLVIFNNPAGCIDGCDAADLLLPEPNASVFWSDGGVVEHDGVGDFHGWARVGEVPGEPGQLGLGPGGLVNVATAEVHVVIKYHGPASQDPAVLYEQTHTILGTCFEGANALDFGPPFGVQCFDPQAAPHRT